ncbi:hypothetical protein GCM10010403_35940 [Glycomyces rutgersensis]|uniref:Uncharacterized protein n=1 Tax=Glycomyces rutgersensis TaxID=58115 RepID=A0ABP5SW31_9ACTN
MRKICVSTRATAHSRVPIAAIGAIRIFTASGAGSSGVRLTRWYASRGDADEPDEAGGWEVPSVGTLPMYAASVPATIGHADMKRRHVDASGQGAPRDSLERRRSVIGTPPVVVRR